jgi:mannose/fructose/N-acetylgalactosamine-specific phosphotransferase system component IIC
VNAGTVALVAAVGGLVSLERKAFAQLMVSRPIVVAPLIAALLGDAMAGFALGIPLELMFLGNSSFGASTPYHETLAALFASALATTAILSGPNDLGILLPVAFFLSLPWALVGRSMEARQERGNVTLVTQAEEFLSSGHPGHATRHVLVGALGTFVLGAVVTALGAGLGPSFGSLARDLPAWLHRGLAFAWPLALGTSAALAIRVIKTPKGGLLAGVSAAAVFLAWALVSYLLSDAPLPRGN